MVIRTLDLGADKFTQGKRSATEPNPFLGLRGMRFAYRHRDIFGMQIRALLRAGHDRRPLVRLGEGLKNAANAGLWSTPAGTAAQATHEVIA